MIENNNFDTARGDGLPEEIISAGKQAKKSPNTNISALLFACYGSQKIAKKLSRGKTKRDQDSKSERKNQRERENRDKVVNTQTSPSHRWEFRALNLFYIHLFSISRRHLLKCLAHICSLLLKPVLALLEQISISLRQRSFTIFDT